MGNNECRRQAVAEPSRHVQYAVHTVHMLPPFPLHRSRCSLGEGALPLETAVGECVSAITEIEATCVSWLERGPGRRQTRPSDERKPQCAKWPRAAALTGDENAGGVEESDDFHGRYHFVAAGDLEADDAVGGGGSDAGLGIDRSDGVAHCEARAEGRGGEAREG